MFDLSMPIEILLGIVCSSNHTSQPHAGQRLTLMGFFLAQPATTANA
jgi:hypothetical protein